MAKRNSGEVWVAPEYGMSVFLQLVIALVLLWAVVGSFLYGLLLDYLGWNGFSLEVQWTLFLALSFLIAALAAGLVVGIFLLIRRIIRRQS